MFAHRFIDGSNKRNHVNSLRRALAAECRRLATLTADDPELSAKFTTCGDRLSQPGPVPLDTVRAVRRLCDQVADD